MTSPKILLFLHSGSLNRGCEALVRSAVKIIKHWYPESQISLASFAPETDKYLPEIVEILDMNPQNIRKLSLDYLITAVAYKFFKNENISIRKSHKAFINKISDFDICLSIGGDAYCYGEQPIWYELNRQIKNSGKKLILWGCSIGEKDLTEAKIKDLNTFDTILPRETLTLDILKSKNITQTYLVADGAFLLDKEELPLPEGWEDGKMIGMNFSPLVYDLNKNAAEAFENLVKDIIEKTNYHIVFTPHVTIEGNDDYELLLKIFKKFEDSKKVTILPNNLNALQYKGYISRMKFFIGARTHATIAAYSSAVPVLVLGYSVKSKGIAKDLFGEEKLVLGIDEISDTRKLISKFEEMLRDEREITQRLQEILPSVRERALSAGKYL